MSDWNFGEVLGEFDEDEIEGAQEYAPSRDCMILLIDCTPSMLSPYPGEDGEETAFQLCMKCCRSVLLNKVFSSDKDLVGVVLFGTTKTNNPADFKHIYVMQELDSPDADRIRELEALTNDVDNSEFTKMFGEAKETSFSLSDALWTCSDMFGRSAHKFSHRRILLFTREDNPHVTDVSKTQLAKTKARDLADNGITIDLMHMAPPEGAKFQLGFYQQLQNKGCSYFIILSDADTKCLQPRSVSRRSRLVSINRCRDIVNTDEDEKSGSLPDAAGKFEELLTRVRSKDHKKRPLQRTKLKLHEGLELGIGVYSLVRPATKPTFKWLDEANHQDVKTQTRMLCNDTGKELTHVDIKFYRDFGGKKAIFEKEEIAEMKQLDEFKGIKLLGFKPRSRLKLLHHLRPSNFLYPDESVVKGSKKLFSLLLSRCLANDLIGYCWYQGRGSAPPRLAAMLPQAEEKDESGVQVTPPGFHMIYLPFADDFRKLRYEKPEEATEDQIDATKNVIKKLMFQFKSESFENPSLQREYRVLEALALEKEDPDEFIDYTKPDAELIVKKAGQELNDLAQILYPSGYQSVQTGAKRVRASADQGEKTSKKSCIAGEVDFEGMAKAGQLDKLTIPLLKQFLAGVGKKATGKKGDLVQSVIDHFS